jgi:tetratricopeptide (TPR) repeat protein
LDVLERNLFFNSAYLIGVVYLNPKLIVLKKIFLIVLSIYFTLPCFSQNNYVDSLLRWLNEHPALDSNRVMNTHRLSYRYSEIDASKAWGYAKQTEDLANKIGFEKGKCLANINFAILETVIGNFQRSADYYLKAIAIAEKLKFTRGLSISYNNIGENYMRLKEYEKCIEYSKKALALNHLINENRGQAVNLEQIGSAYFKRGQFEIARQYWEKGVEYAKDADNFNSYSQIHADLGKYYAEKQDWQKSAVNIQMADSLAGQSAELLYRIFAAKARAYLYSKQNKLNESISSLHNGLSLSKKLGNRNEECEIYDLLAVQFEKKKVFDSSYIYLRKFTSLSDTLLEAKNIAHVNFVQTQYETQEKDQENKTLRMEKQLQNRKLNEKNWLLYGSLFLILLACLTIFLVYRVLINEKHNQELEEANKISKYNQQVAELEIMALRSQMNPHFLFNSLNSIRNFIIKNEPNLASEYLANFAKLMRRILDASQQSKIILEDEVEMLTLYLDLELMRFSNRFVYSIRIDEELRDLGIAIPSMVLQPFIENAIWHGLLNKEDGEDAILSINFIEKEEIDNEIICEITDNGIGREASSLLKTGMKLHKSKGIDITRERLIKLSSYHHENPIEILDLQDKNGIALGTKVIIQLPIL